MSTQSLNPGAVLPTATPQVAFENEPFINSERQLRAVHIISHLDPKYGGVSAVVPQLGRAIANGPTGCQIQLGAFCEPREHFRPAAARDLPIEYFPVSRRGWRAAPASNDTLSKLVTQSSLLHIHGVWQLSTAASASIARRHKTPYIISAHGMLESWALGNKRWKKHLYLALVERANLRGAACLHALTAAEVDDYRRLGLRNPIAVIPNGVEVPTRISEETFLSHFPGLAGKRLILFLGRIHYKKGLDILVQAWESIARSWPDAHLVLAGPDFEGTKAAIQTRIQAADLSHRVTFTGMLTGDLKWSALAASEHFVLPSYSEGLSVSTLEAMGSGKPIIITDHCNLPEAGVAGAGTIIPAQARDLEQALHCMLRLSTQARLDMGARGAQLVADRFSWPIVGDQMARLYRWVLGGPKPKDFTIDEVPNR